jgi:hypothetical protein
VFLPLFGIKRITPAMDAYFSAYSTEEILDLRGYSEFSGEYFTDQIHLNYHGANLATQYVCEKIENLIIELLG